MKDTKFNKVCKVWFLGLLSLLLIGAASQGGKIIQGLVQLKSYVTATNADRGVNINPPTEAYVYDPLADVTDGTDAGGTSCPAGTGFCYYVDMSGYRSGSFQLILDSDAGTVTATAYGTIQNDCAPAACDYSDITSDTFGVVSLVSAAAPATDLWVDDSNKLKGYKYVYISIVAATAGNTGDWRIDSKRVW